MKEFWERVRKDVPNSKPGLTACWEQLPVDGRPVAGASWLAWMETYDDEPPPRGLRVEGICGNLNCCNPDHLFLFEADKEPLTGTELKDRMPKTPDGSATEEAYLLVGIAMASLYFELNRDEVRIVPIEANGWRWQLRSCVPPFGISMPVKAGKIGTIKLMTSLYVGCELSAQKIKSGDQPCSHSRYFKYLAYLAYAELGYRPADIETMKQKATQIARKFAEDPEFSANADALVATLLDANSLVESDILKRIYKDQYPLYELSQTDL